MLYKIIGPKNDGELNGIKRAFRSIFHHRILLSLTVASQVLAAVLEGMSITVLGLAIAILVDTGSNQVTGNILMWLSEIIQSQFQTADRGFVFVFLVCIAVFGQVLKSVLQFLGIVGGLHLSTAVRIDIGRDATLHTMSLSYASLSEYRSGKVATLVEQTKITSNFVIALCKLSLALLMLTAYSFVALSASLYYGLIMCVGAVAIWLVIRLIGKKLRSYSIREARGEIDVWSHMFEYLSATKLLRIFNATKLAGNLVNNARRQQLLSERRANIIQSVVKPLYEIFVILGVGALLFGAYLLAENPLEAVPTMFVYSLIVFRAYPYVAQVNGLHLRLSRLLPRLGIVESYLDKSDKIYERVGGQSFEQLQNKIEFCDVSFKYLSSESDVLKDISLTLETGRTIALVGESGEGKTTIFNLISGLYEPTKGSILVDGQDLKTIRLDNWRSKIAVVEQDVFLFNSTIKQNITFPNEQISLDDVKAVSEMAGIADLVEQLPKGYETVIGDRGFRLSGGQKQRIALARALIRDPQLLLLDEATSALDSESEELIQRAIEDMHGSRTIIMIAHRLSTIKMVDWIVVIQNGRVAEQGTHSDLLKRGGYFSKIWNKQLGSQ